MSTLFLIAAVLIGCVIGAVLAGTQQVDEEGFPVREDIL